MLYTVIYILIGFVVLYIDTKLGSEEGSICVNDILSLEFILYIILWPICFFYIVTDLISYKYGRVILIKGGRDKKDE